MDERFGSMVGQQSNPSSFHVPGGDSKGIVNGIGMQINSTTAQMDEDEDLLENFDGIPRFSLIDLLD